MRGREVALLGALLASLGPVAALGGVAELAHGIVGQRLAYPSGAVCEQDTLVLVAYDAASASVRVDGSTVEPRAPGPGPVPESERCGIFGNTFRFAEDCHGDPAGSFGCHRENLPGHGATTMLLEADGRFGLRWDPFVGGTTLTVEGTLQRR